MKKLLIITRHTLTVIAIISAIIALGGTLFFLLVFAWQAVSGQDVPFNKLRVDSLMAAIAFGFITGVITGIASNLLGMHIEDNF